MRLIKSLFIVILVCISVISCHRNDDKTNIIEVTGTIQKQGFTTYQYGTHTISDYAIQSNSVNLDNYVNQNVTIIGHRIDGYPIDGGPVYLEVEKIKL